MVVNTQAPVVRDGRYLMIGRGEFEDHAPGARCTVSGAPSLAPMAKPRP